MRDTMPLVMDSEFPPVGKPISQHGVLDMRQLAGARHRRMGVEKAGVVELQNREVDAGRDGEHGCRYFVAGCVGLHLDLAGVEHDVGVGQDAFALDHHAGAG